MSSDKCVDDSFLVYKKVFDNSPEGQLLVNKDGFCTDCNTAVSSLLKITPENIIGKFFLDLFPKKQLVKETYELGLSYLQKALDGEVVSFEWVYEDFEMNEFSVDVQLICCSQKREELIVFWRDTTKLKKLQAEKIVQDATIMQQSKLAEMGEMVGAIAHQWKQPINTIFILAESLDDMVEFDELNDDDILDVTTSIRKQAKFMSETIDDFRKFLVPSNEQVVFSIHSAIKEILGILKFQFLKHNIEFVIQGDKELFIKGFPNEFKQTLLNIFKNSSDAFDSIKDRDKIIRIDTSYESGFAIVTIKDNAGGIVKELLPDKLFKSYVTTKGDSGTGIGLQLARKIISEHFCGSITCYNIDDGACFEIRVPTESDPT